MYKKFVLFCCYFTFINCGCSICIDIVCDNFGMRSVRVCWFTAKFENVKYELMLSEPKIFFVIHLRKKKLQEILSIVI